MPTDTAALKKQAETLVESIHRGGPSSRHEVASLASVAMSTREAHLASIKQGSAILEAETNAFKHSRDEALMALEGDTWVARLWRRLRRAPSHVEEALRQVDLMAAHMDAADVAGALIEARVRYLLDDADRVSEALAVLNMVEFEVGREGGCDTALWEHRRQLLLAQAAYRHARLLLVQQKTRAALRSEMLTTLAKTVLIIQGHTRHFGFA